jgi:hypothetical protein
MRNLKPIDAKSEISVRDYVAPCEHMNSLSSNTRPRNAGGTKAQNTWAPPYHSCVQNSLFRAGLVTLPTCPLSSTLSPSTIPYML